MGHLLSVKQVNQLVCESRKYNIMSNKNHLKQDIITQLIY